MISTDWLIKFQIFAAFFAGLIIGFAIFSLLYLYSVLKNLNKQKNKIKDIKNNKLSNEEMNKLIKEKQKIFQEDIKDNPDDYIPSLLNNCKNLILETSSIFYPNSPFPYLEITIEEILTLIKYLHDRLENLFDKKIIFYFRKMTLRQIFVLKQKLIDKKYLKKYQKTNKILNFASNTLNCFNPFHWAKKFFIKIAFSKILDKIGCTIILIIGEEIYQIYSKKIFSPTQNINDILNELEKELKTKKNNL
ncbi:hypothetical protein [Columbia Basin potato purple top phytoplasma]|uniref:Uncharacterized protein n=1 Tax=Columbia Basin potato purple top phytoplasma TaxID=307134 RepID=A0ABT5L7Y0_9MOLU|nr:hypothetical protein [Columbia Basin potato purple top phytoplasma]MDC9031809.1 hypothetical protein [Columbia Basin potato purple top phytoplasma]